MPNRVTTTIPNGGAYVAPLQVNQTEVGLVNRCLRAIGEVPLPDGTDLSTIQLGTDVDIATRVVRETLKEVLAIGWYFNTDYNYKFYPDETTHLIELPEDLIRMDTQGNNQYIMKQGKVYDTYNNTFEIQADYVETDCVWEEDPEYLPIEAYEYIALRSARKFQEFLITAAELVQVTREQEMDAYTRLQRRQLQTQAYNIQNPRVSTRVTNGYLVRGLYNFKSRR